MNKQDLSAQTKVPGNGIDEILAAMDISKDLPDYNDQHVNLIQSIRDIHKNEGCKSWAEAVGIYRKPINEAQLQEIAVRHAIAHDRIPEILAAMKLKPETLTDEQLTLFETVCQQIHAGMDFEMAVQSVAPPKQTRGKKAAAQALPEFAPQSQQAGAITPANNGPKPGLAVQDESNIDEFVSELGIRQQVELIATDEANRNAPNIADAPFDGVYQASEKDQERIADLSRYGAKVYDAIVSEALSDPAVIEKAKARALARRDARRAARGSL